MNGQTLWKHVMRVSRKLFVGSPQPRFSNAIYAMKGEFWKSIKKGKVCLCSFFLVEFLRSDLWEETDEEFIYWRDSRRRREDNLLVVAWRAINTGHVVHEINYHDTLLSSLIIFAHLKTHRSYIGNPICYRPLSGKIHNENIDNDAALIFIFHVCMYGCSAWV